MDSVGLGCIRWIQAYLRYIEGGKPPTLDQDPGTISNYPAECRVGLDWIGLGWIRSVWIGLNWIGLEWPEPWTEFG